VTAKEEVSGNSGLRGYYARHSASAGEKVWAIGRSEAAVRRGLQRVAIRPWAPVPSPETLALVNIAYPFLPPAPERRGIMVVIPASDFVSGNNLASGRRSYT